MSSTTHAVDMVRPNLKSRGANLRVSSHPYRHTSHEFGFGLSPTFVDGKVLLATGSGDLWVFKHDKKPKKIDGVEAATGAPDMKAARAIQKAKRGEVEKEYLLAKLEFPSPIGSTPVVANGVLYVMTENALFAIKTK